MSSWLCSTTTFETNQRLSPPLIARTLAGQFTLLEYFSKVVYCDLSGVSARSILSWLLQAFNFSREFPLLFQKVDRLSESTTASWLFLSCLLVPALPSAARSNFRRSRHAASDPPDLSSSSTPAAPNPLAASSATTASRSGRHQVHVARSGRAPPATAPAVRPPARSATTRHRIPSLAALAPAAPARLPAPRRCNQSRRPSRSRRCRSRFPPLQLCPCRSRRPADSAAAAPVSPRSACRSHLPCFPLLQIHQIPPPAASL
ncbi:hypothetical protein Syun_025242 [Stephania yunnanensis]|uniref:Uncharacterized protein n=1 Tax=Stephania yunnanensis TaxID=152371 RepID=A0AAP0EU81_9MAGN